MNPLETLAYAIARGVARAWFDVLEERKKATEEKVTDEDHARADRIRAAIPDELRGDHHPRFEDPAPGRQ